MEFCPDALVVGDVATWLAAVGSLVVGALAWRTSQRAARIAEEATKIAANQHDEVVRQRRESARILGRLLQAEIVLLPVKVGLIFDRFADAIRWEPQVQIVDPALIGRVLEDCRQQLMPGSEVVDDRIHNLPDSLGADLATLIGAVRTLRSTAELLQSRWGGPVDDWVVLLAPYPGRDEDLASFRSQLEWLSESTAVFAVEFEGFVKSTAS